jgi:hypothetical protein
MSLPLPNLDDRNFNQLVDEASTRIKQICPEWTDLTVHNPGMVLLDAFAYLTETLIYRLNRLPSKAYVAFLNLIDVQLQPPAAAAAVLLFKSAQPVKEAVEIPRGTRVASSRSGSGGEPVVFTVDQTVRIEAGQTSVTAVAYHSELVDAELIGRGTGLAGLKVKVKRPPIISASGLGQDLIVGVEAKPEELTERAPARRVGDTPFRIWRAVDTFVADGEDPFVFVVDRAAGLIKFAPAAQVLSSPDVPGGSAPVLQPVRALAGAPLEGREIRAWYRRGGGAGGNVARGALDTIKDPIPGASLTVTNPDPAQGGRDAEPLSNALVRGPVELHSLRRAVTARDFEGLALRGAAGVARARAFTQKALWEHAVPGTVDVVLVPDVPQTERGEYHEQLSRDMLAAHQSEPVRQDVSRLLDSRRPLGTSCLVRWARYKSVAVNVEIALHDADDQEAVRTRIDQKLHQALSPLSSSVGPGWTFGDPLLKSRVYDIVLSEPGVRYARNVSFSIDASPGAITCLDADRFQRQTWYAGSGGRLYRSTNDGDGWEMVRDFGADQPQLIAVNEEVAGTVAVAVKVANSTTFRVYLSRDCGESWLDRTHSMEDVTGLAWTSRDRTPLLLVSTRKGLFEISWRSDSGPLQILVYPTKPNLGFTALAAGFDARGTGIVAVSAESATEGVFLSTSWGKAGTFVHIGLTDSIKVLEIQRAGPTTNLWAGLAAPGDEEGRGCHRWEVREGTPSLVNQSWVPFIDGWKGGSVYGMAFIGSTAYAATHRRGVLTIDPGRDKPSWTAPGIDVGVPLRQVEVQVFKPVLALATGSVPGAAGGTPDGATLMAATEDGTYRKQTTKAGDRYVRVPTIDAEADMVTVPRDWLISSGDHKVTVVDHEGERD